MLRSPSPPPARRRGFTLVELLVVIAIIATLVGLLMAAVQAVRGTGDKLKVKADFEQIGEALSNFKAKFNRLPPCNGGGPMGTFRLCSEYPAATDAWPEKAVMKALFGRLDTGFTGLLVDANTAPKFILFDAASPGTGAPTTWNGLPVTKVAGPILLDPNQCLVFFLSGGSYTDYLGFATNPTQPFAAPNPAAAGAQRLAGTPFFEGFTKNKERLRKPTLWLSTKSSFLNQLPNPPSTPLGATLVRWEATAPNNDTIMTVSDEPWYLDPWGTPYLYLATSGVGTGGDYPTAPVMIGPWGGRFSGYNRTAANQFPNAAAFTGFPAIGITAFRDTATRYANHNSYQLISGGPNGSTVRNDRTWGFGRNPTGVATYGAVDFDIGKGAGGDDYVNFREKPLGAAD